jgi:hypothetical protein
MTTASGGAVEEKSRRKRGGGRGGETNDRPQCSETCISSFWWRVWCRVLLESGREHGVGGRERSSGFLCILDEEAEEEEEGEGFESLRIL